MNSAYNLVASKIRDDEIKQLLFDLIRIPSVNPECSIYNESDETEIVEYLFEKLSDFGLKPEKQNVDGNRSNIVVKIRGTGQKKLVFNGHLDTVSGDGMQDPFTPKVSGGRVYGRGASDMKAGLAAMIEAAKAIISSGVQLSGELILSFVVDEENSGIGTRRFLACEHPDFAIVGEPTRNKIGLAQAGYIELKLESRGEMRHGSTLKVGENRSAYVNTVRILNEILALPILKKTKNYLDTVMHNTVNFCLREQRESTSHEWALVDFCRSGILIGVLPDKNATESCKIEEDIIKGLENLIDKSNKNGEHNKLSYHKMHGFTQSRDKFVRRFERTVDGVQGACKHIYFPSFCDAAFFHNKGIPTLLYGPGQIELGHGSNESVDLNQVNQATRTYANAALGILNTLPK